jgi:uncharacterized protein YjbI with pentapeptide repeats
MPENSGWGNTLMSAHNAAETRVRLAPADLQNILDAHERYVSGHGGVRASFKGALLDGVDLSHRKLDGADFTGASLIGANMNGASLSRASLYCADLRHTVLHSALLQQADIRGASFRGADLAHAILDDADLRAATMMVVGAGGISVVNHGQDKTAFGGVDFSNCSLRHTSFGKAKLDGAIFHGALLVGTNFRGARLTNASFTGAVLMGVNLLELNLPHDTFAGCVFDVSPQARALGLKQWRARRSCVPGRRRSAPLAEPLPGAPTCRIIRAWRHRHRARFFAESASGCEI